VRVHEWEPVHHSVIATEDVEGAVEGSARDGAGLYVLVQLLSEHPPKLRVHELVQLPM
jgi:hypothetical protein